MSPKEIRRRLREKEYTQARIARELGISRQRVNRVILKKESGFKIKKKIACVLGLRPERIWPGLVWPE
jgi:lambda repressor-like predicted transcriptional regulator